MRPLIALVVSVAVLVLAAEAPRPTPKFEGRPTFPRPALIKGLFGGQQHLLSDYFWLLTINRVGTARTPEEHREIYHYADFVTDLDPLFARVYSFAGVTIPVKALEDGTYVNTEEAETLLRKGVKFNPDDARAQFQLAYNLMFFSAEYREAADIIHRLSLDPTSPPWYSILATRLYAAGGDLDTSEALTRSLLETCIDETDCETYRRRLIELQQESLLREIDAAVASYREAHGELPRDLASLVRTKRLPGWPQDPFGGEIFIDEAGLARSTATKHRLELIRGNKEWPTPPSAPTTTP